ncbi:hypothetical protein K466DRAFT_373027 [Polyporus arcularius HHB13444]|uniref:Uncharacterized protein n=1 Tax=Polyporus arcularius HHB13444 TaxID=1314778 RepID=A0A5C3NX40_9APHY|nr:hypothetical protein K466DRAFT_373027 [Polyporus arcularius HHB13444]
MSLRGIVLSVSCSTQVAASRSPHLSVEYSSEGSTAIDILCSHRRLRKHRAAGQYCRATGGSQDYGREYQVYGTVCSY